MSTRTITREQAETSMAVVVAQFREYTEPIAFPAMDGKPALTMSPACPLPTLLEGFNDAPFTIMWEDGPDDWAYRASAGGTSEEERVLAAEFSITLTDEEPVVFPEGVFAEPLSSYALGLYPA
jgi:hypothetical protein